jgi:hypothetical protein
MRSPRLPGPRWAAAAGRARIAVVAAVVTVVGAALLGIWTLGGSSPGHSESRGVGDTSVRAKASTAAPSPAPASSAANSSPASLGTPVPSASPVPSSSAPAARRAMWRPMPGVSWQWQLSGVVDTSVNAQVYDIDAGTPEATVAQLHAMGRRVICYVDVGSWEPDRADAGKFPASVRGKKLDGWDESWLDIRQVDVLRPLIAARFDVCKSKGFDAVEPDNVDGYTNDTGFPLTAHDQLAYNTMVAQLAHQRGLAVALKNDIDQAATLAPSFDFAINEQCVEYDECDALEPFVAAGKAVLHVEYNESLDASCGKLPGFSSMRKHLSLDAWREACP